MNEQDKFCSKIDYIPTGFSDVKPCFYETNDPDKYRILKLGINNVKNGYVKIPPWYYIDDGNNIINGKYIYNNQLIHFNDKPNVDGGKLYPINNGNIVINAIDECTFLKNCQSMSNGAGKECGKNWGHVVNCVENNLINIAEVQAWNVLTIVLFFIIFILAIIALLSSPF